MLSFVSEPDADPEAIHQVVTAAFGRPNEAELIAAIRNSPNFIPKLSILAAEDGVVLGHILFSPIIIAAPVQSTPALALAPLAVIPARQRHGIGTQLVQAGLLECRELGHSIIVVLGNPRYYSRFGFQTASKFNIQAPFPVPDEALMMLELEPSALTGVSGTVRYPAYFEEV